MFQFSITVAVPTWLNEINYGSNCRQCSQESTILFLSIWMIKIDFFLILNAKKFHIKVFIYSPYTSLWATDIQNA